MNSESANICSLPKFIEFQFFEHQEMRSSIVVQNLINQVVSFKIKTNKINLCLVKPTEGNIYNKDQMKISFFRKELGRDQFQQILSGAIVNKEKFLIEFTSTIKDPIGREKVLQQSECIEVKFVYPKKKVAALNQYQTRESIQKQKQENKSGQELNLYKSQLEELIKQKESLLQSQSTIPTTTLNLIDFIVLLIIAFMIGFIL